MKVDNLFSKRSGSDDRAVVRPKKLKANGRFDWRKSGYRVAAHL
jgi:hypothetical protein